LPLARFIVLVIEPTQKRPRLSQRPSFKMFSSALFSGSAMRSNFPAARIVEREAVAPRDDQPAARARRERAEFFRRRPAFDLSARRIEAMHRGLECIDPVERVFAGMPARHLAEHVVGVRHAGHGHADLASLRLKKSARRFFCSLPVVVSGRSVSFTNVMSRGTL
jgi:hypothetical protein